MALLGQKIGGWVNLLGGRRNHEKVAFCWDSFTFYISTLYENNEYAPENGWLEYEFYFLLGFGLFSEALNGC